MMIDAERGPFFVGLNVIAMPQLAPPARVESQAFDEIAKSPPFVPVIAILAMFNVVLGLTFVNVTVLGALVTPTCWLPKSTEVGATLAILPVPLSVTAPVPALLTTVKTPDRTPPPVGVNVTFTVQLAAAANVDPHPVLATANSPAALMLVMPAGVVPVFLTMTDCDALVVFKT
jgi:hypothetical protein